MRGRQGPCRCLPRGPIKLLRPRHCSDKQDLLYGLHSLAIWPVGHAPSSAEFFQVRGDILRGVIREALLRNAADIVFGADDRPSYHRWLHALRLHVCPIARPKTILSVSVVACYCLTWLHVLVSSIT